MEILLLLLFQFLLAEELEAGKIKDDDMIVMVGFGGGLTWGAIAMRWGS